MTAALPVYRMQAQRQVEEELIFRGEEYMRAIQKYQRRFGAYPPSLEALEQQNGLRFIRKLYTDPTSDKKAFRLIYLNPDGSLTGSKVYAQTVNNNPGVTLPAANINNNRGGATTGAGNTAGNNTSNQTLGTSGIIGVASDTDQTSIKVYNGRQKYNEWEFIAILGQPGATNTNAAGGNVTGNNRAGNNVSGNPAAGARQDLPPGNNPIPSNSNPFSTTPPRR